MAGKGTWRTIRGRRIRLDNPKTGKVTAASAEAAIKGAGGNMLDAAGMKAVKKAGLDTKGLKKGEVKVQRVSKSTGKKIIAAINSNAKPAAKTAKKVVNTKKKKK